MERLFITGITGAAGGNLALALAERFEVLGISFDEAVEAEGIQTARCPLSNPSKLASLALEFRPDWIIQCGPASTSSWDAGSAVVPNRNELRAVAVLLESAAQLKCRLTVLSTDAILAGPRMFHEEACPAASESALAQHARDVEKYLEPSSALVVRTHVYGWSPAGQSFAERTCEALACGAAHHADGCRHATPILATDLAPRLLRAYELGLEGLYHISGAERTSPHRFASELASVLGYQPRRALSAAAPSQPSQHDETSLNCRRARRALDMPMPMLREGLERFAQQAQSDWRSKCRLADHSTLTYQPAA